MDVYSLQSLLQIKQMKAVILVLSVLGVLVSYTNILITQMNMLLSFKKTTYKYLFKIFHIKMLGILSILLFGSKIHLIYMFLRFRMLVKHLIYSFTISRFVLAMVASLTFNLTTSFFYLVKRMYKNVSKIFALLDNVMNINIKLHKLMA